MNATTNKREDDDKLHKTLKDTMDCSDAPSTNISDAEAIRPAHRKPAKIDKGLVDELADQVDDQLESARKLSVKPGT